MPTCKLREATLDDSHAVYALICELKQKKPTIATLSPAALP
ncbi:aminoalkylphosphonic acid N-acetyltransferase [Raoultella terrigena]|uniref:Aminoalkylphosphonic acid N-acetyltransferase n=1 Tax=Raoultella terrigena TaxID=577 RepID=A0A3P8KLD7_RAOTE|nr:aminoalkylphosphonic acid N-acetyltransferase [Raoultella terrigena]